MDAAGRVTDGSVCNRPSMESDVKAEPATIADVDPHDFYTVAAVCRILRISRPSVDAKRDMINFDAWGRIPGYEVLRLAGIDWRVESTRTPKGDVRKRIKELI